MSRDAAKIAKQKGRRGEIKAVVGAVRLTSTCRRLTQAVVAEAQQDGPTTPRRRVVDDIGRSCRKLARFEKHLKRTNVPLLLLLLLSIIFPRRAGCCQEIGHCPQEGALEGESAA